MVARVRQIIISSKFRRNNCFKNKQKVDIFSIQATYDGASMVGTYKFIIKQ